MRGAWCWPVAEATFARLEKTERTREVLLADHMGYIVFYGKHVWVQLSMPRLDVVCRPDRVYKVILLSNIFLQTSAAYIRPACE